MNYIYNNEEWKLKLQNRFTKYVKTWSESNGTAADAGTFPSTEQQWAFAKDLESEMKEIGLKNVKITQKCYVYGQLQPSAGLENIPPVLLLAHMDTVDEVSGKNVNPLFEKSCDDTIIKSDGNTLLGADDKAGISAIMTAMEYLNSSESSSLKHGLIEIIFSPDEETGHGMDHVPLELIQSKKAYTVDGGSEGEMETECFNAWAAKVQFTGKACHTGTAKEGGMINANLLLAEFLNNLPAEKRPETTENYEGFIAPMECSGSIESAKVELLLRSFYPEEIEEEKIIIKKSAQKAVDVLGGSFCVDFKQQYLNMKEKIQKNPEVVKNLEAAYEKSGVKIIRKPIRGGTDGSRLTEMGIPTPNIFTGGHDFHSRNEWCSLNQMSKSADVLINLVTQI